MKKLLLLSLLVPGVLFADKEEEVVVATETETVPSTGMHTMGPRRVVGSRGMHTGELQTEASENPVTSTTGSVGMHTVERPTGFHTRTEPTTSMHSEVSAAEPTAETRTVPMSEEA